MFIGRERELSKLNKMYQSEMFEFAVLYGRRRVGKTTLIREFMRDKDGIFYMSTSFGMPEAKSKRRFFTLLGSLTISAP